RRDAGRDRGLARGRLPDAGLHDLAEDDLVDDARVNARAFQGGARCHSAELGSGDGGQPTHHLADRRARRPEDGEAVGFAPTGSPRWRAITSFRISLVPSPMVRILASR